MFTGLIQTVATVEDAREEPPGRRLMVRAPEIAADAVVGDSIAVSGCCLTVVKVASGVLEFEAGCETLARTILGRVVRGSRLNLEASLKVGDRLGGHFVTGHIDGVGTLLDRKTEQAWSTYWFGIDPKLISFLAPKGSVAVDGVSLTLVDVEIDRFSVALIPHTLAHTTLGDLRVGGQVNIEIDLLARYVQKMLGTALNDRPSGGSDVS